jgi:hypothetical protein
MTADIAPAKFQSFEFHTRFFPQILWDRLRRKKKEDQGTSFTSTMEMIISLAVCLILAVIGIPSAVTQGSALGWILGIVGILAGFWLRYLGWMSVILNMVAALAAIVLAGAALIMLFLLVV